MRPLTPARPGDRPRADDYNALVAELLRQGRTTVDGGGIEDGGGGQHLTIDRPQFGFWAQLVAEGTGDEAGQYSWFEIDTAGDEIEGGRTGTTEINYASELNGAEGILDDLPDARVWLWFGEATPDGAATDGISQEMLFADPRAAISPIQFLAKITSSTGTTPIKYAWSEGTIDADGVKSVLAGGRTGTTSADWLVEMNNASVATNSFVWARRDPGSGQLWFDKDDASDGGATITVQELDATPTYTGINTVIVNQADGLTLTQPAAGQVRINIADASTTQDGIVNTTTQVFAGGKVFSQQTGQYRGSGSYHLVLFEPGSDTSGRCQIACVESGSNATFSIRVFRAISTSGSTQQMVITLKPDETDDCPFIIEYNGNDASSGLCPKIRLVDSDNTAFDGESGTDSIGNVFKGGIVTSVYTGSIDGGSF